MRILGSSRIANAYEDIFAVSQHHLSNNVKVVRWIRLQASSQSCPWLTDLHMECVPWWLVSVPSRYIQEMHEDGDTHFCNS